MDPITLAIIGVIFMFVLILLQVPIGVAMAVVGVVGYGILSGFGPAFTIIATEATGIISNADCLSGALQRWSGALYDCRVRFFWGGLRIINCDSGDFRSGSFA
jgi:hypothetical protein